MGTPTKRKGDNMICQYCFCEVDEKNLADRCDVKICVNCDLEIDKGSGRVADSEIFLLHSGF